MAPMNADANNIVNAIFAADGYEMIVAPTKIGPVGYTGGIPLGLIVGISSTGVRMVIALGTNKTQRTLGNNWIDLNGSIMTSESFAWASWGDNVYVSNGINMMHRINLIEGGDFQQIAMPNGLAFKYMATVGDFLVGADCREFGGSDRYPFRVQWSGLQRPEIFGKDAAIQADYQDVNNIGQFRGITSGEYGLLLGSSGASRMDYVGPDLIFSFTPLEREVGCDIPNSIIRVDDINIWHSSRGWRLSTGGPSIPIGEDMIDKWFTGVFDVNKAHRMSRIVLHNKNIAVWSFVSKFSETGGPDYVLTYNWVQKAWTYGMYYVDILGESIIASASTDDPVIPLPGWTIDSKTDDFAIPTDGWDDLTSFSAAIQDGTLCRMDQSNPNIVAKFETREFELNPGFLTTLSKVMPLIHSASNVLTTVYARKNTQDTNYRIKANLRRQLSGLVSVNMKDRYHKIGLTVTGPFNKGIGVDITDAFKAGKK